MTGIHFNPELIGYNGQGAFRFWCQKVLPLVYDDSLSYYELLCKVVKYLNNTNEDVKLLGNSYLKLVEFVNGYFDNLDVTSEVNKKLDEMVESGELDDVIAAGVRAGAMQATEQQLPGVVAEQIDAVVAEQIDASVAGQIDEAVDSAVDSVVADKIDVAVESQIGGAVAGQIDGAVAEQIGSAVLEQSGGLAAPAVTEWLEQNVVPQGSAVVVDESLRVQGAAADALCAGTGIRALENEFVWDNSSVEFEIGNINRNTGETETGTAIRTVGFIENAAEVKCNNGYVLEAYAYNKNTNAFVGGYRGGSFTIGESGQDTVIGLPSYYKYKIVLVRASATTANPTTLGEKENAYFLIGTDTTLSLSNKAADAKAVGDALDELASRLGLTDEAKLALLNCFSHVAWADKHGQDYYNELEAALIARTLESITTVFMQGDNVIYDTDSLDDLKPMLTVTAYYDDDTSATVTSYTLSGTLTVGTSTITVSYANKTATFSVTVTEDVFGKASNWSLNTGIYTDRTGQPFADIQATVDKRLLLTNPIELQPNKTYVLSCAENYTLFVAMVDSNGIYRGKVALPAPTGTQITSNSYVPNVSFNTDSYSWISVCVQTPATAIATDVSAANVKLVEADQTLSNLEWSLNKAIYTTRYGEPFANIQATVDERMLLTSLIPLESGKKYAVCCSADYLMYCIGIDANGIYKHYINNGYQADYLTNSTVFENTEGYSQMSIAVKTPATATQADANSVNIRMAVTS